MRQRERWGGVPLKLGLATFGLLVLELSLIRWISTQIRVFAYFNNLILIGAFLGMGLGVALGRDRPALGRWTLPVLGVAALPIALAQSLGLSTLQFPDRSVAMWGADMVLAGLPRALLHLGAFLGVFCLVALVFLFAGAAVGDLFHRIRPLRAYSADIVGSLGGVLAFTALTCLNAPPPVWLALGGLPFLLLAPRGVNLVALAVVASLGWHSARGAVFSEYSRLDLRETEGGLQLDVNRDFHQYLRDFSGRRRDGLQSDQAARELLDRHRSVYDLPYRVNPGGRRALVVGSGSGNDVQAAVRNGYEEIVAVEIDGRILGIGRTHHPERPYAHPAVTAIVDDARAFFERYEGPPFDCVNFGLLDSHGMFSSLSSLRLENYVYTVQGLRAAWRLVSDRGQMIVSFSMFKAPWIADRIYWAVAEATGREPVAVFHKMHSGVAFIVARDQGLLRAEAWAPFERIEPDVPRGAIRVPTDDWPFLYVQPGVFPWAYVVVLVFVVMLALVLVPVVFGGRQFGSRFDPALFFMGAAFLLLETRGLTSLSLLLGSTWYVSAAVFAGVLLLVLTANIAVERFALTRPWPWFVPLFGALLLLWTVDISLLNRLDPLARGVAGGVVAALPVGFAGVIVSILLARSAHPAASLGSNLLGSVIGGCLEYFSMLLGLRMLVILALGCYLLAALFVARDGRGGSASRPLTSPPAPAS